MPHIESNRSTPPFPASPACVKRTHGASSIFGKQENVTPSTPFVTIMPRRYARILHEYFPSLSEKEKKKGLVKEKEGTNGEKNCRKTVGEFVCAPIERFGDPIREFSRVLGESKEVQCKLNRLSVSRLIFRSSRKNELNDSCMKSCNLRCDAR